MTWFILSILSIFALASAELTQQHLLNIKNAFNERSSAVLTFIFQALLSIPFLAAFGLFDQLFSIFNPAIFLKVLLVTFISSVAMIFYFKSFRVKNISISTIFISFSAVISTAMGIAFFSESTSPVKFFGIFLILAAIILVNFKNSILEKNHFYGLIAGIFFGSSYVIDKSIVINVHPLVYMFWAFLLVAIWAFVFGRKEVVQSFREQGLEKYKPVAISGACYFLYNFCTFSAYRFGGEVGRIDAINNSQVFLIILFEFFVLRHTKGTARKLFSAILAITGIFILGMV